MATNYKAQLVNTILAEGDIDDAFWGNAGKKREYAILVAENLDMLKPLADPHNYAKGIMTAQDSGQYGPVLAYLLSRLTNVAGILTPFETVYAETAVVDPNTGEITTPPATNLIPGSEIKQLPLYNSMRLIYDKVKNMGPALLEFSQLMKAVAPIVGEHAEGNAGFDENVIYNELSNVVKASIIKAGGTADGSENNVPPLWDFINEEPRHHESAGNDMNGDPYLTLMETLEKDWVEAFEQATSAKILAAYGLQPNSAPGFITALKVGAWDIFKKAMGLDDSNLNEQNDANKRISAWNEGGVSTVVQATHIAMIKDHTEKLIQALEDDLSNLIVNKLNQGATTLKSPAFPAGYPGPLSPSALVDNPPELFDLPMGRAVLRWGIAHLPLVDIRFGFINPFVQPVA